MAHAEAVISGRGEPSDLPWQLEHVWRWFGELCAGRKGLEPLGYLDIDAWSRLTGALIRPAEVHLIKAIDGAWLKIMAKKAAKQDPEVREVRGTDAAGIKSVLRRAAR
jgi:hypothetical protein